MSDTTIIVTDPVEAACRVFAQMLADTSYWKPPYQAEKAARIDAASQVTAAVLGIEPGDLMNAVWSLTPTPRRLDQRPDWVASVTYLLVGHRHG